MKVISGEWALFALFSAEPAIQLLYTIKGHDGDDARGLLCVLRETGEMIGQLLIKFRTLRF